MTAYVFPGQGAQFEGMGKDLYAQYDFAKQFFSKAAVIFRHSAAEIIFE